MKKEQEVDASQGKKGSGGKFLTFFLDNEEYGLEILRVQEIIGLMPITPVPRTEDYVRGVLNLRGNVIPIIDLRTKFGMPSIPETDETCIIVVQALEDHMGIVVDKVSEVLDISDSDIQEVPNFGAESRIDFILGMGLANGCVRTLLDIEKVLQRDAMIELQALTQAQRQAAA